MVVVSHDREFLDQLCTKIVETERGVATTYSGNYTQYTNTKARRSLDHWIPLSILLGWLEAGRLRHSALQ